MIDYLFTSAFSTAKKTSSPPVFLNNFSAPEIEDRGGGGY